MQMIRMVYHTARMSFTEVLKTSIDVLIIIETRARRAILNVRRTRETLIVNVRTLWDRLYHINRFLEESGFNWENGQPC